MKEVKDRTEILLIDLLKTHPEGLTIVDIMSKLGLARHTVLARLHGLRGKGVVDVRQINMAKVHYWIGAKDKPSDTSVEISPLKEEHIRLVQKKNKSAVAIDFEKIKEQIAKKLKINTLTKTQLQLSQQRLPISHVVDAHKNKTGTPSDNFIVTGIPGFDDLFDLGIPKGSSVLIAGGAGTGKTLFSLQTLFYHASRGEKCLYMSFEESEERLISHMRDFDWDPEELIKKKKLLIKRFNPFDITRSVDALLMKAKGELLIDIEPIIFPENYQPDFVVVDSLTAIASAFTGKEDSYRIYIEQLFRFFEKIRATSFLVTETKQIPTIFSQTGVEEFLADGVVVLYNIKRGNLRENAIEVLKLRGAKHQKKIVAMQISNSGIVVYPEQEIFGAVE